jgi:hypothetical protein
VTSSDPTPGGGPHGPPPRRAKNRSAAATVGHVSADKVNPEEHQEVAAADTGSRADVIHLRPAASELAGRLLRPQASVDELLADANEAARTAYTASQLRDDAIRLAVTAGVELDAVAHATGLTVDQIQRITLSDSPG